MMDSNKKQIANEAIEALIALGHKHAQAKRMVNEALAGGFEPADAASILQHVYQKPSSSGPQSPRSPYAGEYAEYYSGSANYRGQHSELMQIARAVGPGLSPEEFAQLAKQVEAVQSQRDHLTGAAYQSKLWAIPEEFKRSGSVHFRPTRDRQGNPIDVSIPPVPRAAVEGLGGPAVGDAGAAAGASDALSGLLGNSGGGGGGVQDSSSVASNLGAIPTSAGDSSESLRSLMQTSDGGAASQSKSPMQSGLDSAQAAADAIGVVDQTGITDLSNAGVSIIRAISEPDRRGEHLSNAAISAISAIPIVGDLAKLGKYGKQGAKAAGHVDAKAQAAMQAINLGVSVLGSSGGSGGAGGGGGGAGGGAGGDQGRSDGDGGTGKATAGLNSFSDATQKFVNNTVAAVAGLTVVGNEVYNRALKPLLGWFQQIDAESRTIIESNRPLSQYSGTLGAAYQNLEGERLGRNVTQADEMSGSLTRLIKSQSQFEDAKQDLYLPYEKLMVELQALRSTFGTEIMKILDKMDVVGNVIDLFLKSDPKGGARNAAERADQMFEELIAKRKVGN